MSSITSSNAALTIPVNIPRGLESFGGLMADLGLTSLTLVYFEALINSGSPQDRINAVKLNEWNSGEKPTGPINASTSTRVKFQASNNVKFGPRTQFQPSRMRPVTNTTRMHSASSICAAAFNARCSTAVQTKPATRRPSTKIIAPIKGEMKAPRTDNSGPRLPPRDGGGGGGGGGHWAGGFFLFWFIAFLALLREMEHEAQNIRINIKGDITKNSIN